MLSIYIFPCGPLETNALLIACEQTKKAAVVDPAFGSCQKLLDQAKKGGFSIEKILLTHSHWDHFVDACEIKEKTGAILYVHELDAENLKHPGSDGLPLFFQIQSVHPDVLLKEGDRVGIGEHQFEIIHTPGHSPGGVCFYSQENHLLISGDTLFRGTIGNLSLPTSEPSLMWQSLQKLAMLPLSTRVIPGHGEETTIQKEKGKSLK